MEEQSTCPICWNVFKPPIRMTKCGHSFCQNCLKEIVAARGANGRCPECGQFENLTPENLSRNYALEKVVKTFKPLDKNICSIHNSQKKLREYFKSP